MLISHLKKFIYFKNIKTASSSIEAFFTPYCIPKNKIKDFNYITGTKIIGNYKEGVVGDLNPRPDRKSFKGHVNASRVKKIANEIDLTIWDKYFKFCSIRNPWDKIVSYYFFRKNPLYCKTILPFETDKKVNNFQDFVRYLYKYYLDNLEFPIGFKYYTIKKEFICDFYIRFENLKEDIKKACDLCSIKFNAGKLPSIHSDCRNKKIHYSKFYNDETKDLVAKMYKEKINKFNYTFESN